MFNFGLWTLSLIGGLIDRQFGKKLSLSAVSRIMKLLGFSAQKPLYQVWQQDAQWVRQWETQTYPAIRAQARKEGAIIYVADESGIRSDYHTGTTWSPKGQTPVIETTGARFSLLHELTSINVSHQQLIKASTARKSTAALNVCMVPSEVDKHFCHTWLARMGR